MPKNKSHSGASKRFKVTGSGKVLRERAGKRHLCRNTVGVGVNRPGCFADYLVIPADNAFKLPDSISEAVLKMPTSVSGADPASVH